MKAGIVAIPDEWAIDHNLSPTQRSPWNTTKWIYTLKAPHTLHLLVYDTYLHVYDKSLARMEATALPIWEISIV